MDSTVNDPGASPDAPGVQPQSPPRQMEYRPWMVFVVMGFVAAGLMYLYFRDPTKHIIVTPCAFHTVTGLYCPGCGTTRAIHSALHGHILQALAWNPLTTIVIAIASVFWFWFSWLIVVRKQTHLPPIPRRVGYALLAVLIIYWILRNLPFEPFSSLAPHDLTSGPPR